MSGPDGEIEQVALAAERRAQIARHLAIAMRVVSGRNSQAAQITDGATLRACFVHHLESCRLPIDSGITAAPAREYL